MDTFDVNLTIILFYFSVSEYEEAVQMSESRISKLKGEIRRLQSMDCTSKLLLVPKISDSPPILLRRDRQVSTTLKALEHDSRLVD